MTLVMAGLRNSGRSLIWTMGEYGWNMTTGPAACGRAWMPWQTISNGRRQQNPEQAHSFPCGA